MEAAFKSYQCFFCGHIYAEAEGHPSAGFPPGTRWDDIPDDWSCPDCGAMKSDFALLED